MLSTFFIYIKCLLLSKADLVFFLTVCSLAAMATMDTVASKCQESPHQSEEEREPRSPTSLSLNRACDNVYKRR